MKKRRIVIIYWVLAIVLLPGAAYAYIDPATTTYLIQIITALVVMAGVSLTVFVYRFRTITSKIKYWLYGIFYHKNRKNTKNEDAGISDGGQGGGDEAAAYAIPEYAEAGAGAAPELTYFDEGIRDDLEKNRNELFAAKTKKEVSAKTYKGRVKMIVPLAIAFCFTFVVIGCLELAVQYSPDIPFRLSRIVPSVLLVFAVVSVVLIVVIPAFRGKLFEILFVIGMAVLIAGYLQGNFLNWGIGALTGDTVVWGDLKAQFAASLICWIGCLILMFLLRKYQKKFWKRFVIFAPLLLIVLQSVSLISVVNSNINAGVWGQGLYWQSADQTLTIDRINEVASKNNVIVLLLDRMDQTIVEDIAAKDPAFFEPFDGFTEFDDYTTWFGGTMLSVSGLLTGHRYVYDMTLTDYLNSAWENADMLNAFKNNGADIRFYMEPGDGYDNINQIRGIANNVFQGELGINKRIALVKLIKLSGYRFAPLPLKHLFWLSPYELMDSIELTDQTAPYMSNDIAFYERLVSEGLRKSDNDKSFIYYHLKGAHSPFDMDENIHKVENSSYTQQAEGAFKIVYEYIDQLKQLGLYDNSTIIVTGDHGIYQGDNLVRPAHVALFVKPAGSSGTPLAISHAHVSMDQFQATLMKGMTGDTGSLGDTFFDVGTGDDIVREYNINLSRYKITGDGRDFNNWQFIGLFPDTFTYSD